MRAGKLDRSITIERLTVSSVDDAGREVRAWTTVASPRAQLLQSSTEEFIRAYGEADETVVIFRTRWLDGILTSDRVVYSGRNFNIKETKEIGRRVGLELRCEEVPDAGA